MTAILANQEKEAKLKKNNGLFFKVSELQFGDHRFQSKHESVLIGWKHEFFIRKRKIGNYMSWREKGLCFFSNKLKLLWVIHWLLILSSESPQPSNMWSECPFSCWLFKQLLKTMTVLPSPKFLAQSKQGQVRRFLSKGHSNSILKRLQSCQFFTACCWGEERFIRKVYMGFHGMMDICTPRLSKIIPQLYSKSMHFAVYTLYQYLKWLKKPVRYHKVKSHVGTHKMEATPAAWLTSQI